MITVKIYPDIYLKALVRDTDQLVAHVAQLVEHFLGKEEVPDSISGAGSSIVGQGSD